MNKIIKVSELEQPFAACDHCNNINNLPKFQFAGTTWCEACLEEHNRNIQPARYENWRKEE
jgi:hypothetical protein